MPQWLINDWKLDSKKGFLNYLRIKEKSGVLVILKTKTPDVYFAYRTDLFFTSRGNQRAETFEKFSINHHQQRFEHFTVE